MLHFLTPWTRMVNTLVCMYLIVTQLVLLFMLKGVKTITWISKTNPEICELFMPPPTWQLQHPTGYEKIGSA